MDFGANKTPVEVIKEGAFWGTYFRDIIFGVNGNWYRKLWEIYDELKNLIRTIIAQVIMMLVLINMVLRLEHH